MAGLVLVAGASERRWVLRRGFERGGRHEVLAEVADGLDCLTAVRELAPDALVVDLDDADDSDRLDLVDHVARVHADLPVVLLAGPADPDRFERALRSAAVGVVSRDAPVLEAVAHVEALLDTALGLGYPEPA